MPEQVAVSFELLQLLTRTPYPSTSLIKPIHVKKICVHKSDRVSLPNYTSVSREKVKPTYQPYLDLVSEQSNCSVTVVVHLQLKVIFSSFKKTGGIL